METMDDFKDELEASFRQIKEGDSSQEQSSQSVKRRSHWI